MEQERGSLKNAASDKTYAQAVTTVVTAIDRVVSAVTGIPADDTTTVETLGLN